MKLIQNVAFAVLCTGINAQSPTLVIPKGHTGAVTSASICSDGKYLLTGSRDLSAKIWDLKGNEIISFLAQNEVQSVDISEDSKMVLVGSADNHLQLFKATGELIKTFSDHKNFINSVAFSPSKSQQYFASASEDGSAIIYDYKGTKIKTLNHSKAIKSICFDTDGKKILTSSDDRTAVLWSMAGIKLVSLIGHSGAVNQARISKDGIYFLTCSQDKSAILWDKNGVKKQQIRHLENVTTCDIANDNSFMISGSYDGEIKVWKPSGGLLITLDTKLWGLSAVKILPDGKSFICTSEDEISQWSIDGRLIRKFDGKAKSIHSVCFSKDEKAVIQGDKNGWVKIWDAYANTFQSYQGHHGAVLAVACSPDSIHFLTGGEDKLALLWNKNGTIEKKFKLESKVTTVNFSKDGKSILTGCYDGCTSIWSLDGNRRKILKQEGDQISEAIYSPDGNSIITSSYSKKITQFDTSGTKIKVIQTPSQINCLAFTKDKDELIVGYYNGMAQVWDMHSGESLHIIGQPDGDEVLAIASSPDKKWIAIGKNSGAIELFDNTQGKSVKLMSHNTKVQSLNFSGNNNMLLSGSADGTIRLWDCKNKNEYATLIALDTLDWVIATPAGLFDASSEAMLKLKYRVGMEMIDIDQLKERYYEPGLLQTILKVKETELRDVSSFNSVQLYPQIDAKISGDDLIIKLTERDGSLGKLSVFVNDKEVIEDANSERKAEILPIRLTEFKRYFTGDSNRIVLRTFNKEGWLKSSPYELIYHYQGSKGSETSENTDSKTSNFTGQRHLFAIIVGTSDYSGDKMDLIYPDKDARAFASAIKQVGGRLFEDRVHIYTLTTSESAPGSISSKKNIEKTFNEIAQKASSEDIFIVYLSGHGTTYGDAEKAQFYYLTKDIQSENLSEKAIRDAYTISSEDLTKWLTANPTRRQVVIIDACHSGDVVKSLETIGARDLSPSQIKAFERMKDRTGIFILTGSAGDKVSYESSQFGQGLLTYSLLQGMSGKALTEDKRVDVSGLFNFSKDAVPELAKYINKIQKPVFVAPHGASSFDIGISDKLVKIDLVEPKPIFIQSTFQNSVMGMDDVEFMPIMKEYLQSLTLEGADAPIVYSDVDAYPNAFKMGGLYTVDAGKITATVNVIKNKQRIATLKHEGNANDLKAFAEALFEKVFHEIQGK